MFSGTKVLITDEVIVDAATAEAVDIICAVVVSAAGESTATAISAIVVIILIVIITATETAVAMVPVVRNKAKQR